MRQRFLSSAVELSIFCCLSFNAAYRLDVAAPSSAGVTSSSEGLDQHRHLGDRPTAALFRAEGTENDGKGDHANAKGAQAKATSTATCPMDPHVSAERAVTGRVEPALNNKRNQLQISRLFSRPVQADRV